MSSFLKINFYDQHSIKLKRLDPMRPMDLGDGPELLELSVTVPRSASETTWNPLFGTRSLYTGYLNDGSTSRPVFIKWARSKQRMEELKREGDFYCSALRKLQGVVVPNFHGYYTAMGHSLQGLGCMIIEQMDSDRGDISSDEIDNIKLIYSRSKLEAAYRLHKAGVRHCKLHDRETFVTHGDKVYVVGFSEAKARCGCEMTRDRVRLCPEMMWIEQKFGDGETNSVLKEIGVPPGWRGCLAEATKMAIGKPHEGHNWTQGASRSELIL